MENLFTCPVCESNSLSMASTIEDYFLTHENFQISECKSCGFLFTNPRPDASNLPKYYQTDEYLSHNISKKTLISSVYSFIRNISIKKKYALINRFKTKGKILDIGCGSGELLNYFKQKGWETLGVEPAEKPRKFATSKYGLSVFAEEQLDFQDQESFDVIMLWHVLEHVSELNARIAQIKKLLKKDGIIIIALPNSKSWDAKHYKNYWAAWDIPRHLYHFSMTSFSQLLVKHELRLLNVFPMKFDAYYVSLLSEKYKTGHANFLKAFLSGLFSNLKAKMNSNNYSSLIYLIKK